MKKDWIRALLSDSIQRREPIAVLRKKLGLAPLLCVPLGVGEGLALVAPYVDFLPDGYELIRLRDISRVGEEGAVAFHARIMREEGVLTGIAPQDGLPLSDYPQALQALMERGEPVIVTGKNDAYLLGAIGKIGKNRLGIYYIDGEGHVDGNLTRIAYEDIISVCYGTRYLRLVSQYATPMDQDVEED